MKNMENHTQDKSSVNTVVENTTQNSFQEDNCNSTGTKSTSNVILDCTKNTSETKCVPTYTIEQLQQLRSLVAPVSKEDMLVKIQPIESKGSYSSSRNSIRSVENSSQYGSRKIPSTTPDSAAKNLPESPNDKDTTLSESQSENSIQVSTYGNSLQKNTDSNSANQSTEHKEFNIAQDPAVFQVTRLSTRSQETHEKKNGTQKDSQVSKDGQEISGQNNEHSTPNQLERKLSDGEITNDEYSSKSPWDDPTLESLQSKTKEAWENSDASFTENKDLANSNKAMLFPHINFDMNLDESAQESTFLKHIFKSTRAADGNGLDRTQYNQTNLQHTYSNSQENGVLDGFANTENKLTDIGGLQPGMYNDTVDIRGNSSFSNLNKTETNFNENQYQDNQRSETEINERQNALFLQSLLLSSKLGQNITPDQQRLLQSKLLSLLAERENQQKRNCNINLPQMQQHLNAKAELDFLRQQNSMKNNLRSQFPYGSVDPHTQNLNMSLSRNSQEGVPGIGALEQQHMAQQAQENAQKDSAMIQALLGTLRLQQMGGNVNSTQQIIQQLLMYYNTHKTMSPQQQQAILNAIKLHLASTQKQQNSNQVGSFMNDKAILSNNVNAQLSTCLARQQQQMNNSTMPNNTYSSYYGPIVPGGAVSSKFPSQSNSMSMNYAHSQDSRLQSHTGLNSLYNAHLVPSGANFTRNAAQLTNQPPHLNPAVKQTHKLLQNSPLPLLQNNSLAPTNTFMSKMNGNNPVMAATKSAALKNLNGATALDALNNNINLAGLNNMNNLGMNSSYSNQNTAFLNAHQSSLNETRGKNKLAQQLSYLSKNSNSVSFPAHTGSPPPIDIAEFNGQNKDGSFFSGNSMNAAGLPPNNFLATQKARQAAYINSNNLQQQQHLMPMISKQHGQNLQSLLMQQQQPGSHNVPGGYPTDVTSQMRSPPNLPPFSQQQQVIGNKLAASDIKRLIQQTQNVTGKQTSQNGVTLSVPNKNFALESEFEQLLQKSNLQPSKLYSMLAANQAAGVNSGTGVAMPRQTPGAQQVNMKNLLQLIQKIQQQQQCSKQVGNVQKDFPPTDGRQLQRFLQQMQAGQQQPNLMQPPVLSSSHKLNPNVPAFQTRPQPNFSGNFLSQNQSPPTDPTTGFGGTAVQNGDGALPTNSSMLSQMNEYASNHQTGVPLASMPAVRPQYSLVNTTSKAQSTPSPRNNENNPPSTNNNGNNISVQKLLSSSSNFNANAGVFIPSSYLYNMNQINTRVPPVCGLNPSPPGKLPAEQIGASISSDPAVFEQFKRVNQPTLQDGH